MRHDRGRILLMEDKADLALILRYGLEGMHFCCLETHTEKEAMQAAKFFRPDLVLLDLRLGGVESWAVLERLRTEYKKPILVMSASRDLENKRQALKLGATQFLVKPFGLKELLDEVSHVLPLTNPFPASGKGGAKRRIG